MLQCCAAMLFAIVIVAFVLLLCSALLRCCDVATLGCSADIATSAMAVLGYCDGG
jgi:hypothetical protein